MKEMSVKKNSQRFLTLSVIWEIQTKSTMRYQFVHSRRSQVKRQTNTGENVEPLEFYTSQQEGKMIQPLWTAVWKLM